MFIKNRWLIAIVFLVTIIFANSVFSKPALANNNSIIINTPPTSIQQWYKPKNKRQVWLHTMFRLRRELLAITDYSQQSETELTQKWFDSFKKDYLSVAMMVPEWQEFVDTQLVNDLELAVKNKDYSNIPSMVKKLEKNCNHCHNDYQAVTRLLYRSADFYHVKVQSIESEHKLSYSKAMVNLSNTLNRLKIAIHDELYPKAISYIQPLTLQLDNLSASCIDCHYYPSDEQPKEQQDYIFKSSTLLLKNLEKSLAEKDNKKARINLGGFAVKVCARCHATHRTISDLKDLIE